MRRGNRNNNNKSKAQANIKPSDIDADAKDQPVNKMTQANINIKSLITKEQSCPYPTYPHLQGDQLHQYFKAYKQLKLVEEQVDDHIAADTTLLDASVKNRNREDETYLHDQELQERLRRGNTLLSYIKSDGKKDYLIARRGKKIFFLFFILTLSNRPT